MPRSAVIRAPWIAMLIAIAVGCSDDSGDAGAATGPTASPSSPVAEPPPQPPSDAAYDSGPPQVLPGLGRCGPQPSRLADQKFELLRIRGARVVLPAITAGRGPTVAVLLHQTDGHGLCGWLEFAQRVASVSGQTALAFDLCGYGETRCRGASAFEAQVEQVRIAIDHAVEELRATRVVLVGASMGGSLAVLTAAYDDRVDAVVDLSGPDEWRGALVRKHAARLEVPVLVAMAEDEGADKVRVARSTADAAPDGSEFAGAAEGHGYQLLQDPDGRPSDLSGKVLAWIGGS